jgi:hypothetical protein
VHLASAIRRQAYAVAGGARDKPGIHGGAHHLGEDLADLADGRRGVVAVSSISAMNRLTIGFLIF